MFNVGVDEVGRGCLAGPVVAAAVSCDSDDLQRLAERVVIRDSKKMTSSQRVRSAIEIRKVAKVGLGVIEVPVINEVNILEATFLAMREAIKDLGSGEEGFYLVDGNRPIKGLLYQQRTIVKGDATEPLIACASIVAKVYRDDLMKRLALEYPDYGWEINMGYGTALHIEKIRQKGLTPEHRALFCRKWNF
jgi:ribonuclease HII